MPAVSPTLASDATMAAANTVATLKAFSAASWPVPLLADSDWASYFTLW